MSDQNSANEMTMAEAKAFLQKMADNLGVTVENLVAFTKQAAQVKLHSSPERLSEIAKAMGVQPVNQNRRQRRKAAKMKKK
jgi:2-iminoacetate synthase ThiH